MDFLSQLSLWIKEISVILGAIGSVYFFIYRALNKLKPYTEVIDKIKDLNEKIDNISSEFKNNHGTSLKDQICVIENSVKENTKLTKSIFYRQRWLLDNRIEPIFEADSKGYFTWVNDAFIRLVKRGPNDLLNNKWRNVVSEDHRESIYSHWEDAIKQKRNFEQTIYITDKNGDKYSAMCVACLQEDGNYIGTLLNVFPEKDS